jgi:hypothetical protein
MNQPSSDPSARSADLHARRRARLDADGRLSAKWNTHSWNPIKIEFARWNLLKNEISLAASFRRKRAQVELDVSPLGTGNGRVGEGDLPAGIRRVP